MRLHRGLLAFALVIAGCGGTTTITKTVPAKLGTPQCQSGANHYLGQCLPQPVERLKATQPQSSWVGGADTSNWDPIYSQSAWNQIRRARNAFAYVKAGEGTGYVDPTAAGQIPLIRAAGLIPGAYWFVHLCWDSADTEALLFSGRIKALGLNRPDSMPPVADTEYGSGSACNAGAWMSQFAAVVHSQTGLSIDVYTGQWFWGPNLGCYWVPGAYSWISGYTGSLASVPTVCGHPGIDDWQDSDHGYNGYNSIDHDIWTDGLAALLAHAHAGPPPPPPDPYRIFFNRNLRLHGRVVNEYLAVKRFDENGCENPVRRAICGDLSYDLELAGQRIWAVAHRRPGRGNWGDNRGRRLQDILKRRRVCCRRFGPHDI